MATFNVEVDDDEIMPLLIEQCIAARMAPHEFLSALIEDVLLHARDHGLQIAVPGSGACSSVH